MFGTYRYILALMVVMAHLAPLSMVHVGFFAVFAFFTLSGYLMALVLETRYFHLPGGTGKYLLNRLLRILPSYWAVLAFSAAVTALEPTLAHTIHERMNMPSGAASWLQNVFVLGLTGITGVRSPENLVPPAWSLSVEIVFWGLMPLLVRWRVVFALWGALAVAYTLFAVATDAPLTVRYYSHLAGALPFFIGAAIYRFTKDQPLISPLWGVGAVVVSLGYTLFAPLLMGDMLYDGAQWYDSRVLGSGLYIALLLHSYTIYALAKADVSRVGAWWRRLDAWLGHLSYPVFLLHVVSGVLMVVVLDHACESALCGRGWGLFAVTLPLLNALAIVLWRGVERLVAALREKVKTT